MSKAINLVSKYWFSLSVLLLLAVSFLSLSPLEELPNVPGSDKTQHLIAYALLAFPTAVRKPNGWIYIILFFAIYSGAIEVIQPYVNRYGEWTDFIANLAGLLIGSIIALIASLGVSGKPKYQLNCMPGMGNDEEDRRVETLSSQALTVSKPVPKE